MRITKLSLVFLTLFVCCKTPETKVLEMPIEDNISNSNKCIYHRPNDDSLLTSYIPLYSDTINSSHGNSALKLFLDSVLKYKEIQNFISDSSATIYVLNEIEDGADTCNKTISLDLQRMRIDIRNFKNPDYFLALTYSYQNKSIFVLNNCKSKDSCTLAFWTKNCW